MRTLLTPRLVLLHVVVLVVVVGLASLGVWQLSRHDEASVRVANQASRLEQPTAPISQLLDDLTLADTEALAELEYRPVTASGSWRTQDEVLQRGRSYQGRSGFHALTPFDLDGGGTLVVRRGWVPFEDQIVPPVAEARPPAGPIAVEGYLERSIPQPTGAFAQSDPDRGELDVVFNADLERLGPQLGGDLLPMVLHLERQQPPQPGDLPIPAPRPDLDRGPHLGYAVQWFSFAVIAAGMYALWLRRRVRGDERAISADATGSARP